MSLCSCSSCSTFSSSSNWSESSNSYRLLSSSSITTVSSLSDYEETREDFTTDDEQGSIPSVKQTQMEQQDNWRIEKNISLKNQQANKNTCILKAIMTKEQILICDSSSTGSRIIPGKHVSMKVVFKF